tara:strand:+ start:1209 stop:2069 length:861 start_codon:yes stop_codon:yes gene_type:complete
MPELPEVEIIKQSLKKSILYKKIIKVLIKNRNLRFKIEKNLNKLLSKKKIIKVSRKSKYLIIYFEQNQFLIIHFGMSGTLHLVKKNNYNKTNLSFYNSENLPKKHNHIIIFFKNFKIIYNDPRRFGYLKYFKSYKKMNFFFSNLGLEPLDKNFNLNYLKKIIINKNKNIKNFLLDQKYISGIGNIYANEILYYSKINPYKNVKKLNISDLKKIIYFSKFILKKAIKKGGSTIRDFKNTKGIAGSFQNEFKAYNRENKNCLNKRCLGKIIKVFISNRSSYFCKNCQK